MSISKDKLEDLLKQIPKVFGTDGKTIKYRETPWGRKKEKDITTHRMDGDILAQVMTFILKETYSPKAWTTPTEQQIWEGLGDPLAPRLESVDIPPGAISGGIIEIVDFELHEDIDTFTYNLGTPAVGSRLWITGTANSNIEIMFGQDVATLTMEKLYIWLPKGTSTEWVEIGG